MFEAASCNRCHRVGSEGYPVGPDLTSVSRRFSRRDLLDAIITPSKVIPEIFRSVRVVTKDGIIYTGASSSRWRLSIAHSAARRKPTSSSRNHRNPKGRHRVTPTFFRFMDARGIVRHVDEGGDS